MIYVKDFVENRSKLFKDSGLTKDLSAPRYNIKDMYIYNIHIYII